VFEIVKDPQFFGSTAFARLFLITLHFDHARQQASSSLVIIVRFFLRASAQKWDNAAVTRSSRTIRQLERSFIGRQAGTGRCRSGRFRL
jgi:hypothetical protein